MGAGVKATMARKPTLSPTRISIFLACPTKYYWTYRDPRGKFFLRAKSYYSFGTTLHKVLERFHDSRDSGVTTVGQALAAYDESWIDAGFSSPDEMAEAYSEGIAIIESHVESSLARTETVTTLAVERQFSADMGDFRLIGRIDRLDELADGTLEIVDYKSGRGAVSEDDVKSDLAMGIYQYLVQRMYPDRKVQARIIALRANESATARLSAEELQELEFDLRSIAARILDDSAEHPPQPKALCAHCDFRPLCLEHGSFAAELAAKQS